MAVKFADIPQFIIATYQVTVEARHLQEWIDDQIKDGEESGFPTLELNPDFQRGHVWTEEQQIAFVEFVLRGGKSGRDLYFNCPSWSNSSLKDGYNDFVCVDGLQRITAITKFYNNELPVFGHKLEDFEDKPRAIRTAFTIHINELKTKKDVLRWYLEMNGGGTIHSKEELDRVLELYKTEI